MVILSLFLFFRLLFIQNIYQNKQIVLFSSHNNLEVYLMDDIKQIPLSWWNVTGASSFVLVAGKYEA